MVQYYFGPQVNIYALQNADHTSYYGFAAQNNNTAQYWQQCVFMALFFEITRH